MIASRSRPQGFRADIQALRAVAILFVLAHHARIPFVPGGFLGVDIFFVISGYLMGRIIDGEISGRAFNFGRFYARRARRLLPASISTLVVTAIAAPLILDKAELQSFAAQLAGSFTFVVNFVLWRQSDYFGSAAELKPLLHMWSLAVEEQYYLVLPLFMVLFRRLRLLAVSLLVAGSAAICVWGVAHSPSAAFFFSPARFWELGLGTLIAILVRLDVAPKRGLLLPRIMAVGVILIVPFVTGPQGHPGWPAAAVCLATAMVMIPGGKAGRSFTRLLSPLLWIGDRSYSLYLVHWPIYAFAANLLLAPPPIAVSIALIAPCFAVAALQYALVEQRFRHMSLDRRAIVMLIIVPVVTTAAIYAAAYWPGGRSFTPRPPNLGLARACDAKDRISRDPACRTTTRPRTLVWGDSFGMHVASGAAATLPGGILQATKTFCGPFLGIAAVGDSLHSPAWAHQCMRFNQSVVDALASEPSIDTVLLASSIRQYLPDADPGLELATESSIGVEHIGPRTREQLLNSLGRTIAAIRAHGKAVAFVAPPPSDGLDHGRCAQRQQQGLLTLDAAPDCGFPLSVAQSYQRAEIAFLQTAKQRFNLPIIWSDSTLCPAQYCRPVRDNVMLYADHAHLTPAGAVLASRLGNWKDLAAKALISQRQFQR